MNLLKLSFEESEYVVDEAFVERVMEKSNNKRFIAILAVNLLVYALSIMTPLMFDVFVKQKKDISINWQWPVLVTLLLCYFAYLFLSIKNNKRNVIKKYLTNFYLTFLMLGLTIGLSILTAFLLSETSKIMACLSILLMIVIIFYTFPRLLKGVRTSVANKEPFNLLAYLISEKAGNLLLIMGTSGVAAGAGIVNIASGGASNKIINAIITPFVPTVGYLIFYFLLIETYKGYYVVKYFEQYRVKYNYSIEDWYGKN